MAKKVKDEYELTEDIVLHIKKLIKNKKLSQQAGQKAIEAYEGDKNKAVRAKIEADYYKKRNKYGK